MFEKVVSATAKVDEYHNDYGDPKRETYAEGLLSVRISYPRKVSNDRSLAFFGVGAFTYNHQKLRRLKCHEHTLGTSGVGVIGVPSSCWPWSVSGVTARVLL